MSAGLCSAVMGVGYPHPNRSHFLSMDVWHTGISPDANGTIRRENGWLGRALDTLSDTPQAAIAIADEAPLAMVGKKTTAVTFERADLFRWAGGDTDDAVAEAYEVAQQQKVTGWNDPADFLRRTALDAQVASEKVRVAVSRDPQTKFPRSGLGRQLQAVAAMIAAGLPTRGVLRRDGRVRYARRTARPPAEPVDPVRRGNESVLYRTRRDGAS